MILGVDGWSVHDEDADHLAHLVREVVGARVGATVAARSVLATHEVRAGRPHSAVSCVLRGPAAGLGGAVLGGTAAGSPRGLADTVVGLVEAVAAVLPAAGAVVATAPGLHDGTVRGSDADALAGAWAALATAATGASGRLVHFDGAGALVGRLTVADVLGASAVEEVVVVGGSPHTPDTVVDTGGFVRPQLEHGRVRLLVQPAAGGVLVPFERENPHRCCEDH